MKLSNKIRNIIFHEGDIETVGFFSKELAKTFKEYGYQVFIYDYREEVDSLLQLKDFIIPGHTAFITFNFTGLAGDTCIQFPGCRTIWDENDIACINIVVDHPFYYHRFFPLLPKNYFQYCIDLYHLAYMNRFFPKIACDFLPLAGTELSEPLLSYEQRPIDIVFTGNYTPPETFHKDITRINDEYTEFFYGIINDLIDTPNQTMESVFERHLRDNISGISEEEIRDSMATLIFIDLYVRFHYRGEAVKALTDAGLKVHVFGSGWEKLSLKHPENLIRTGMVDSKECLKQIAHAKISLNVMPWFKNGAHDRIFNSMLNGAVCVTDSSKYLNAQLNDHKDVVFYSLEHLKELPVLIKELLNHPDIAAQIAANGYQTAKTSHTWADRAKVIIEHIKGLDTNE